MSIELKIKSKHLSEEARIIRHEEHKLLKQYQWGLTNHKNEGHNDMYPRWNDKAFMSYCSINHHRKWDVRNENRATYLARAYIAGVPYSKVERTRRIDKEHIFRLYVLPRVFAMVVKYGNPEGGDWEWDKTRSMHIASKKLKDKIIAWCEFKQ